MEWWYGSPASVCHVHLPDLRPASCVWLLSISDYLYSLCHFQCGLWEAGTMKSRFVRTPCHMLFDSGFVSSLNRMLHGWRCGRNWSALQLLLPRPCFIGSPCARLARLYKNHSCLMSCYHAGMDEQPQYGIFTPSIVSNPRWGSHMSHLRV